ncbi:MAG: cell division protein FtsZ [Dehalococcoidia bacterium]|nr:cell division protein FtsZ [Dehalococcoidia bacterium]
MAEDEVKAAAPKAKKKKPSKPKKPAGFVKGKFGVANMTVVGVGGGGCNTVSRLMEEHPIGINFVCVNTDAKALQNLQGDNLIVIPIGELLTKGFGAGGRPEVGAQAAESNRAALKQVLSGSDIVFITTGLGGGTGTGAAPVVAEMAKKVGALTIAMVTLPFSWEGHKRMKTALSGLSKLRDHVDNVILINNDMMTKLVPSNATMQEAFKIADSCLTEGILVVNEIVNQPGEINVDLADVKVVLELPGNALMTIGEAAGKDAALAAAENAIRNPMLDLSVAGAKGILFTIKSGPKLTLNEVNAAGKRIAQSVSKDATIFFGMSLKPEMQNKVRFTIIATGIPDSKSVSSVTGKA